MGGDWHIVWHEEGCEVVKPSVQSWRVSERAASRKRSKTKLTLMKCFPAENEAYTYELFFYEKLEVLPTC